MSPTQLEAFTPEWLNSLAGAPPPKPVNAAYPHQLCAIGHQGALWFTKRVLTQVPPQPGSLISTNRAGGRRSKYVLPISTASQVPRSLAVRSKPGNGPSWVSGSTIVCAAAG